MQLEFRLILPIKHINNQFVIIPKTTANQNMLLHFSCFILYDLKPKLLCKKVVNSYQRTSCNFSEHDAHKKHLLSIAYLSNLQLEFHLIYPNQTH